MTRERLHSERSFHDQQALERARALRPQDYRFSEESYLQHESWIAPAFNLLGGVRGLRVLDLGCGHGMASVVLARRGADVVACDLSLGYVREAQARADANGVLVPLLVCDGERLPFADNTFDAVTCSHSFHHYPRQQCVVAEMHRVLRPDGRLLIIDGDRDRLWGRLIFDVLVVMVEGPVRHRTGADFRQLYQAAGFDDVSQCRRRGPLPFLMTVGRAVKPAASAPSRRAA